MNDLKFKDKKKNIVKDVKYAYPDNDGRFGIYGGRFIPETLMHAVLELEKQYNRIRNMPEFKSELDAILKNYAGRPTPLTFAKNLSEKYGCKIYLKREDLLHGGAHKLNNTLGQALLAKYMGKRKLIAETGAGQHGFATTIAGAYFGMQVTIFMGKEDIERQKHNVFRIQLLGGKIIPVTSGSMTLKDATNEALRHWITNVKDTYYLIGSVIGPHPYPMIVRDFQSIIGREIRKQIIARENTLPDSIIACIGGGSNAIGAFYDFINDPNVELIGVEAGGEGPNSDKNAIALGSQTKGILHGSLMYLMQDEHGNVKNTHSISAGLDYPGVGPEHCFLYDLGRLKIGYATDSEVLEAFKELSKLEGIIPALESSHALAYLIKLQKDYEKFDKDDIIVVNLSGSGSKDLDIVKKHVKFDID
ncbi:MAG: tryptophan synthase subunit beta [Promethearchaeota archaeon]